MIFIDEMKNMKIYRRPMFLPYNDKDKKHGSLIYLLTPNYPSSKNLMANPLLINRRYFESYYMERNAMLYINPGAPKDTLNEYTESIPVHESAIHNGLDFDAFDAYILSNTSSTEEELVNEYKIPENIIYYPTIMENLVHDKVENGVYNVFTHPIDSKTPVLLGKIEVLLVEYAEYKAIYKWIDFSDFEFSYLEESAIGTITRRWNVISKDNTNNACCEVIGYDKPCRERASLIILDGNKVFCKLNSSGEVEMPGGGLNPGENPQEAAEREAREEARLIATDVKFEGTLIEYHEEVKDWVKENVDKESWWYGYYTYIFVGKFSDVYNGKIADRDKDEILNKGDWYDIDEISDKMPIEYVEAIKSYRQGKVLQESEGKVSNVYFSNNITGDEVVRLFDILGKQLNGKVAVKLHSGELGNKNFIKPEFWKPIIDYVHGTIVECNTAYAGQRTTTEKHKKVIKAHGWDQFDIDIMDEDGEDILAVKNGNILNTNIVGDHLKNYDSILVLSHFKGHAMGGFGGSLKNISIGIASHNGKKQIHRIPGDKLVSADIDANQDEFLMAMADAAKSVIDRFHGNMVFINVMKNISVDCDCDAHAKEPSMEDIGILISDDPVALDQACVDIIYSSDDPGKHEIIERIESRKGTDILKYADKIGAGTRQYNLIDLNLRESANITFSKVDHRGDVRYYPLDKNLVDKYKDKMPGLKHVRLTPNNVSYIFIDNETDKPIGFVAVEDKTGDKWIQALEVAPDFKRQGYGQNLLQFAQNQGAKFLSVAKNNDIALNLYDKNGWKINGGTDHMHFMIHESEEDTGEDQSNSSVPTPPTADNIGMPDLSHELKNMVRRIKMRGRKALYKIHDKQRDILSHLPTADSVQPDTSVTGSSEAFNTVPYDLDGCFLMENSLMVFDEANPEWNPHMKKVLYNERIRTSKEQMLLLKKVKSENPWIKYAFPTDFRRYQNRNVFYDLSYYIEIYFKNAGLYKLKRGANLFEEFLERLLDNRHIPNTYTKKTVFIPILDWMHNKSTRMWLFREDINVISCIFDMMQTNMNKLKSIFGNMDIVFFGNGLFFKINFSTLNPNELKTLSSRFRIFIQKITSNAPFDPSDEDDAPDVESTKVIVTNITDKLENRGINMSTQSHTIAKLSDPKVVGFALTGKPIKIDSTHEDRKDTRPTKNSTPTIVDKTAEKVVNATSAALDKDLKKEKEKDIKDIEEKKIKVIDTITKAAVKSKNTNDAIDILDDDDIEEFKKSILDLELEDDAYNISASRAARMMSLNKKFEDVEIKGIKVKDLIDPVQREKEINAPLPVSKIEVDSPFQEQWSDLKFMNFDKSYDANKDIMKMLQALSTKYYPIVIRNISIEDTSTAEDYIDTYTIEMEDSRGKRFTQKLDIPKFKDGKYLILRGNKKTIQNQSFNMPILKTDVDTVQVISNYSKIFIRRFGSSTGKTISYCDRLLKALRKYNGRNITLVKGDNSKLSKTFEAPIDYLDIGKVYNEIHYKVHDCEYIFYFNRDEFYEKHPDAEKINAFVYGIDPKNNYISFSTTNSITISADIANILCGDNTFADIYHSIAVANRYTYSRASIMSTKVPLVVVCSLHEGLENVLRKANIEYELKEKLTVDERRDIHYDWIKFSDGFLYYRVTYESSLLLNGVKEISPETYSIDDINKKRMWIDSLDNFGGRIKADGIENFYECMIDPITYEVLKHYKLPTDYVSLLLYGNALLADNKYISHGDLSSRRFRKKELIAVKVYKALFNDAYSLYANGMRHNQNLATFACKQSAVIDKFMSDPTASDFSVLNGLNDVDILAAVSTKGESGMNAERAYTLDKRTYDSSMINVLGMSTGFSSNVGMTRQATINANIDTERGYVQSSSGDISKMNVSNSLTITEAVTPFGTTRDDPVRTAMTFIQTCKHQVRTEKSDPLLVTSGADEVLPYLSTDIFCKKASQDGTITEYVENKYMIVKYKDGTNDYVDLSERIEKCSDGGFFVNNQLITDLKVGSKVKADQILAYDKDSFSKGTLGESNKLAYNVGKLAKIAVLNSDDNFEDSAMVTTKIAEAMATNVIMMESRVLSKDTNIYGMLPVGTTVNQEDVIYETQNAYDEEDINILLKNLAGDKDQISKLGRKPVKSPTAGEICGMKLYRTCEINEMSESLQKLFRAYEKDAKAQAKHLKELGINDPTLLPSTTKLQPVGKLKNCPNSVLIEIYVRYHDIMSVGDKIVYWSANKGVIHNIIDSSEAPYTDYRPTEEISAFTGITSINKRQIASNVIIGSLNKLCIELGRHVREILDLPFYENEID